MLHLLWFSAHLLVDLHNTIISRPVHFSRFVTLVALMFVYCRYKNLYEEKTIGDCGQSSWGWEDSRIGIWYEARWVQCRCGKDKSFICKRGCHVNLWKTYDILWWQPCFWLILKVGRRGWLLLPIQKIVSASYLINLINTNYKGCGFCNSL